MLIIRALITPCSSVINFKDNSLKAEVVAIESMATVSSFDKTGIVSISLGFI